MKNLLVITLLFSTTAFTNINLICDEPYYFFPDLEERVLFEIDPSTSNVYEAKLSGSLMEVEVVSYNDLIVSESAFSWRKERVPWAKKGISLTRSIDRITGVYKDKIVFVDPFTKKCKKVKSNKFQDALNKLEEYSQKVKEKRKI